MHTSFKARQHAEGRDEQAAQVASIVANMSPLRHVPRRLNPVTGKKVEVR